jgi:hypothetical protein
MRVALRALALAAVLSGIGSAVWAQAGGPGESAEAFFERFVALGQAFDPAVADLYADEATIRSVRRYPDGTARALQLIGAEYKRLIRSAMPLARQRGDRDQHSDVTVWADGEQTRIRSTRYSELKGYTSP